MKRIDVEKRERAYKRLQKEFDRMENELRPSATLEPRGELTFGRVTYNDSHIPPRTITLTNTGQVYLQRRIRFILTYSSNRNYLTEETDN